MTISRDFINLLLAKVDIYDLIKTTVSFTKQSGQNYFARCPFHQEKSASFSVSQVKQFYHCFGCGVHGNAIDFLMNHDHLTFPEAIESLARFAGVVMPEPEEKKRGVQQHTSLSSLYDVQEEVAGYYYQQLSQSERAIQYLKNRGITGETAKRFQLGYASSQWSQLSPQFPVKLLYESGLVIKKAEGGVYDRFRDRIMFPIRDARGRVLGFGGRLLDQGEPKYLNSPETPLFHKGQELYGLYQALKANREVKQLFIVEGYMDVITLSQAGITNVVATLGTATTAKHIERLMRYTSEIFFCFDGDLAGRKAAHRALDVVFPLIDDTWQVRFLFLPEGEDPDSLMVKEGAVQFLHRAKESLSFTDFFFQTILMEAEIDTVEGRAKFAHMALARLQSMPASLFKNLLLKEIEKRARISLAALGQTLKTMAPRQGTEKQLVSTTGANSLRNLKPPMKHALSLLIQFPWLAKRVSDTWEENELGFKLFNEVLCLIKNNLNLTTGALLECFRGRNEAPLIFALAEYEHLVPESGVEAAFLGAMKQLKAHHVAGVINGLLAKGAQSTGLSLEEKMMLQDLIARKKALLLE